MKTEKTEENKFLKFLRVLKNSWYFLIIGIIVFGGIGFLAGEKTLKRQYPFYKEADSYVVLKTNVIISDGNYQDFTQSFNNTCYYFMKSNTVLEKTIKQFNEKISESDLGKIISFNTIDNITNMVGINIKYDSKENTKRILDKYIEEVTIYLNKTLKNNINEDGTFKEGVTENNKIKISQIENIDYVVVSTNKGAFIIKYVLFGCMLGLVVVCLIIYFSKFYFIIHSPYDVIKNFELNLICKLNTKKELENYISENKTEIFCISGKDDLKTTENCFTKDEILNNQIDKKIKDNGLILVIKEDRDNFFLVEKIQLLFKDGIKGFIIYK